MPERGRATPPADISLATARGAQFRARHAAEQRAVRARPASSKPAACLLGKWVGVLGAGVRLLGNRDPALARDCDISFAGGKAPSIAVNAAGVGIVPTPVALQGACYAAVATT